MKWKWVKQFCPVCSREEPPAVGPLDDSDSIISPYPCWECEHPDLIKMELEKWAEADRKIKEATEHGEVKDSHGNRINYYYSHHLE